MIITSIEIKNFCSVQNATLELEDQGLVYLFGSNQDTQSAQSNGSGKTTVLKALCWGCYGKTIDGDNGDGVIKRGEKRADVFVHFRYVDQNWTIVRSRTKGKPLLKLMLDGKKIKMGKAELQIRIEKMLGLDFQSFKNSVLYGQNDVDRFANPRTTDSARKKMLHKILGTGIFEECSIWAREQKSQLEEKMDDLGKKFAVCEAKCNEYDVSKIEYDVSSWGERQGMKIQHQTSLVKAQLEKAKTSKSVSSEMDGLKEQLEDCGNQLERCVEAARNKSRLDDKIKIMFKAKEGIVGKRNCANMTLRMLSEKLKDLEGETCPTCTTPIKSKTVTKYKDWIKGEIDRCKKNLHKYVDAYGAYVVRIEEVESIRDRYEKIANQFAPISHKRANLISRIKDVENSIDRLDELKLDIARRVEEIREMKREINPYAEQLETAKTKLHKYYGELESIQNSMDELNGEIAHWQFWIKGFGNQGLPSMALDAAMPYLTDKANEYLQILADGDITIQFSTQRELKSSVGEMRDEIDIRWSIEGYDGTAPSGGQLKKMEIATDLALMDLVSSRENSSINLMLMDEVLDGLDLEGRNRIVRLLQTIRSRRGTIIVISQDVDYAEMFDIGWCAFKKDGTTTVKLVA